MHLGDRSLPFNSKGYGVSGTSGAGRLCRCVAV